MKLFRIGIHIFDNLFPVGLHRTVNIYEAYDVANYLVLLRNMVIL